MQTSNAENLTQQRFPAPCERGDAQMTDARSAFLSGLRSLIDYMESNPDVPAPDSSVVYIFPSASEWDGKRAEIDRIAALIGVPATVSFGGHYLAVRAFGPVEYRAAAIPPAPGSSDSESE